jgi:hypothetical protein
MADDVHFRFLGDNSWAADFHSKVHVREWLARYVRAGLSLEPKEIVVAGPPWNTIVCTRFVDQARGPDGAVIYRNEGMLFERMAWGRIREHVSYEDTQRTVAFDRRTVTADGGCRHARGCARARHVGIPVDGREAMPHGVAHDGHG